MAQIAATNSRSTGNGGELDLSRELLQRCRNRLDRMNRMLRRYG
jgi:hypothetical protein